MQILINYTMFPLEGQRESKYSLSWEIKITFSVENAKNADKIAKNDMP